MPKTPVYEYGTQLAIAFAIMGRRFFPLILFAACLTIAGAADILPQIETARDAAGINPVEVPFAEAESLSLSVPELQESVESLDGDAFGAQQILKRQERPRPFTAFTEISSFVTNNVAYTARDPQQDAFLVATFGLGYRRPLTRDLALDVFARGSTFRYAKYGSLDFNSVDAGANLTWTPPKLGGITLSAGYFHTEFITTHTDRVFYKNHVLSLGAQKAWALGQAQTIYMGASAQWSFADPKEATRDEYSVFAGYQLQATRQLTASVSYRYRWLVYREVDDRRDHNHTLGLGLRYELNPYASLNASGNVSWNDSSFDVFDYNVWNLGGGIGLNVSF